MKIAVTGCAGFVGSWICEKALTAGYEVIGIDNLTSNVNYTQKEVEFYNLDVNDNITSILKNIDVVVHAAAYAELRHNWENKYEREKIFLNNEMATRSILEQMPNVPIIFMSTGAVYGSLSNIKNIILKEEDACPEYIESPYAASKLACESYIAAWCHKRKTPWYALRLVNQVGARTHRGVITDFIKKIKKDGYIHAADNGNQRKNWVSVEDTADVVIKLLDEKNKIPSGIYTVTSEERWSWKDIINVMRDMYKEKYNTDASFNVTYENCIAGSIGDPINLYVTGNKLKPYYECKRSVEQAVRDALTYLKWV
jgi:nucleoside-diphosphate-sugar epimerase